jgi:glycosyltransferase involved in cell wall biosynthesis
MNKLRILAVAYACDPTKGSESAVGWGWVNAIAATHDVTVLTADFNAANIEQHLRDHQSITRNSLRFIYINSRPWHYHPSGMWLTVENSIAKPLMNIAYQDWLRCAYSEAQREIIRNRYDLVHLITYVGWRFPGYFYRLGLPFVWGPIGGMKNTPWRLLPILGFRGAIYYGSRNLVNSLQLRILPGPKRALTTAGKGVIAATSEIRDEIRSRFGIESNLICEVGPPQLKIDGPTQRNVHQPFRICWSGQHLPGKALPLLLRTVARLPKDCKYTVEILGSGPCSLSWQSLSSSLGIDDHCHWHGWLSRDQSLAVMKGSHVFAITSLKDLTSTVAIEAISLGLPIVSLDHCGFADLVTTECGIKVRPESKEKIITGFADALNTLHRNEPLRMRLAEGAIRRSHSYSWQAKMETLNEIYSKAVVSHVLSTDDTCNPAIVE